MSVVGRLLMSSYQIQSTIKLLHDSRANVSGYCSRRIWKTWQWSPLHHVPVQLHHPCLTNAPRAFPNIETPIVFACTDSSCWISNGILSHFTDQDFPGVVANTSRAYFATLLHDASKRKWQTLRATLRTYVEGDDQTRSRSASNKSQSKVTR
jgi:hypothetical protein